MTEHVNITDPQNHEPKGASIAVLDTVYVSDGAGSGVWKESPFNVSGVGIDRLIDGTSIASVQNPTGTGDSNAIQIEFGPAKLTASDPVNLELLGALNFNDSGMYRIKIALQFGRTGGAGTAELLFRVLVNGAQAGRSLSFKLGDADETMYFENDTWIEIAGGTTLTFEVMRDAGGNDSGGLVETIPTGSWNNAPTAAIRVERLT